MATILHIDPNKSAQTFVQGALGRQHNVVSVFDGPTAVQYCAMIQPDLILVDSDLADFDVHELTLRLKMFMPQTPVIVLVDSKEDNGKWQQLAAEADGHLTKPFDKTQLQELIRTLLPESLTIPVLSHLDAVDDQSVAQFEAQISALNQANQRLASLNAISALIGTSLDLEHLTDELLQQIQKTVNFDSATLFLLKGSILEAAASRGFSEYGRGMNVYHRSDRNSAWRVVNNKLPLIISDVARSEYWEPRPELSRVRSWLGVPLIYKDRVVGVLTLDKNEVGAFTDADARYVFTLAYQIAIAVENAQLFEEWENQATRLKFINEVNHQISTFLDANNLFDALVKAISEHLHYDRTIIVEVDRTEAVAILRACYGCCGPSLRINDYMQSLEHGLMHEVIKTRQPLLSSDPSKLPVVNDNSVSIQSALVVPVFVDSHIEAMISVESRQANRFTDQDVWTLSSLAIQAATVLENARLYHNIDAYAEILKGTIDARTRRLQAIKQISQVVSRGMNLDELLHLTGRNIDQIFTLERPQAGNVKVSIGLLNGAKLIEKTIYNTALASENAQFETKTFKFIVQAPAGRVIDNAVPVILNNMRRDNIYTDRVGHNADVTNSIMIAPLITAGKTIGIIVVEREQREVFDHDDLDTLESVAYQVAGAIEHARLLSKTKEVAIVDERTRLAREMHDGVAQNLAYILIQVDRCLNMVEQGGKLDAQLEQIGLLLEQNIDELRRNIFDLRPIVLEGKSVFEVLNSFVTEFGDRWNLKTTFQISGETDEIPAQIESSLYRIVQEALSNARQHAQCDKVSVKLKVQDNRWIELEVSDDGQGFDPSQPYQGGSKSRGIGLLSIRERAEGVGGRLTIKSVAGKGTRVFAQLPLQDGPSAG